MKEQGRFWEHIQNLIKTGAPSNIDLALQLAAGQGIAADVVMKDWDVLLDFLDIVKGKKHQLPDLFKIQEISYYNGNLWRIPNNIGYLSGLERLELSSCGVDELPCEIGFLKNLKQLYLIGNNLFSLPNEIGELQELETIDVTRNQINELPDSLANLEQLTTLNLYFNPISCLPTEMHRLKKLERLNLGKTTLWSFVTTIECLVDTPLTYLSLEDNHLQTLPEELKYLDCLQQLNLSRNKFSDQEKERIQSLLPNCTIYF